MRFWILLTLVLINFCAPAQEQKDSVFYFRAVKKNQDSLNANLISLSNRIDARIGTVDSLSTSFYLKADSLKGEFRSKLLGLDSARTKLQLTIDSLKNAKLPTGKYQAKIDSVRREQVELARSLNEKIEKLKSQAVGKMSALNLPPELAEKVSVATKNASDFKLPVKDLNISSLDIPGNRLNGLDGFNSSFESPIGKSWDAISAFQFSHSET